MFSNVETRRKLSDKLVGELIRHFFIADIKVHVRLKSKIGK